MWLLQRAHEWIDHAELIVLAFPAEGAGRSPCLDDEVVGFLEAVTVIDRIGVRRPRFDTGAAHEAGHQPAARDKVNFRELLCHADRVFLYGQGVAEQHNFRLLCRAREDCGFKVHRSAHASGRVVVLVEHQAVEADLFAVLVLVEVVVVHMGCFGGIEVRVGEGKSDGAAVAVAHVLFCVVVIGALGESH